VQGKDRKEKGRKCDVELRETAGDRNEEGRPREWSTTSTVATRKFDFQIGVARIRGRGYQVLRKGRCVARRCPYIRGRGCVMGAETLEGCG